MEITTFCLFAFCGNMLSNNDFYNYDIETQLDDVSYKADLNHQHFKYLLRVTDFNVKLQIEDEIRKELVAPGYDALHELHAQASAALKANKDTEEICYSDNKENIINAVRNAFFSLEPCVAKLEAEYVELSSKIHSAKANAEELLAEVDRIRNTCSGVSEETQHDCYDIGMTELTKLVKDSEYSHEKLHSTYHIVIGIVPDALACVRNNGAELNQELQNIQQEASNCYAKAGVV